MYLWKGCVPKEGICTDGRECVQWDGVPVRTGCVYPWNGCILVEGV